MNAMDSIVSSLESIIAPELDTLLRAYGAEMAKAQYQRLEQLLNAIEDLIVSFTEGEEAFA